ncbi:MAG: hypothetical protein RI911_707, partial [Candidatus Parcubacteria bacterium]
MTSPQHIKHLTCIRHGQSEGNKHNVRESETALLSDEGRIQALKAARRFEHEIKVDVILTSPYTRAHQTAEMIAHHANVPLSVLPDAHERKLPSVVVGAERTDPRIVATVDVIHARYLARSHEKMDTEETFDELAARAERVMRTIERRPEQRIALVSHQFFLYTLLTWVACRQHPQPEYLLHLYDTF